jgi:hypothetical protein
VHSVLSKAGWLTGATLIVALVLFAPAWRLYRGTGIEAVVWAGLLCLLPGWAVVWLNHWAAVQGRDVLGVLLGMGLRLAVALGGALAVIELWPDLRASGFLYWLAAFYLVTLVVETRLLTTGPGTVREGAVLAGRK